MARKSDREFFEDYIGPAPTPEERAARKAKYEADTKDFRAAEVLAARGDLVREYRAHPSKWPDGIDTRSARWYRAGEWNDKGKFLGEQADASGARPEGAQ